MKNTKAALKWIIEILNRNKVSYQIIGGLASEIYGSDRPLADIDIVVKKDDLKRIYHEFRGFTKEPVHHYHDENWDLDYCVLMYDGQRIEICSLEGEKIFDTSTKRWIPFKIDLNSSVRFNFMGVDVSVIPKDQLIKYKSKVNRKDDRIDIEEIE